MVKIENVEELKRIKESTYGFIIILDTSFKATMHKSNCKLITEKSYLKSKEINAETKFHWYSTFLLAEKEFTNIKQCKTCNQ